MRGKRPLKVLINRLIEWLKLKGFTSDEIVECVEYITKKD